MLMRFDPFRELDRLAEDVLSSGPRRLASSMPIDAYRSGDRFLIAMDMPGVDPESVEVTVEKNVLTVRAERHSARSEDEQWLVAERPQGSFSRQLFLGETLDTDAISAHYEHGVLRLEIPIAEKAKPRRIEISNGSAGQRDGAVAIETTSTEAASTAA